MFRHKIKSAGGFTMVEMLVAMAIAGIFLTVFIGVVVATFQTLRTGDERTAAQQNARVALRFIVRDLKQAIEISPRRLEEPYDPALGGFPRDENSIDNFDPDGTRLAWPIYRRTTDSDTFGGTNGYIDLDHNDEYVQFRDDEKPFDIRPLAPNRLEMLLNTDAYYSHTQYWDIGEYNLDLDLGGVADNQQAMMTRVTYEHQIAPPITQIYANEFDSNEKDFILPVNRDGAPGINVEEEFCVVRSFETEFFDDAINTDVSVPSEIEINEGIELDVDSYAFRQPLADHIIDVRFRYWHVSPTTPQALEIVSFAPGSQYYDSNTRMLEIRYDPNVVNAYDDPNGGSGTVINSNDGYYRYFDERGVEIYAWYDYDDGSMVDYVDLDDTEPFTLGQTNCFYTLYLDEQTLTVDHPAFASRFLGTGWEDYERGVLLFEGWRFINAVSVTIRATNRENLDKYKSSINTRAGLVRDNPDFGQGFIDFGHEDIPPSGIEDDGNINTLEPFYRAVDSYRDNTVLVDGLYAYDFVEPNINPNYDPNSFVTLEMFVVPPAMRTLAIESEELLTFGFSYRSITR
jgi:prepilin-type N-terminal cleavage/methylation domain-containing protein